jgi:hypothetical protein
MRSTFGRVVAADGRPEVREMRGASFSQPLAGDDPLPAFDASEPGLTPFGICDVEEVTGWRDAERHRGAPARPRFTSRAAEPGIAVHVEESGGELQMRLPAGKV